MAPPPTLWVYNPSFYLLIFNIHKESQLLIMLMFPCMWWLIFLSVLSLYLSKVSQNYFYVLIPFIYSIFDSLSFFDVQINVLHKICNIFNHYFFQHFFLPLFHFFWQTAITHMLMRLMFFLFSSIFFSLSFQIG